MGKFSTPPDGKVEGGAVTDTQRLAATPTGDAATRRVLPARGKYSKMRAVYDTDLILLKTFAVGWASFPAKQQSRLDRFLL